MNVCSCGGALVQYCGFNERAPSGPFLCVTCPSTETKKAPDLGATSDPYYIDWGECNKDELPRGKLAYALACVKNYADSRMSTSDDQIYTNFHAVCDSDGDWKIMADSRLSGPAVHVCYMD